MCTRIVRTMRNQWIVTARPYDQQSDASFFFLQHLYISLREFKIQKKKRKKKRVFYEHRLELVSPKWNSQVGETKTFFWRSNFFSLYFRVSCPCRCSSDRMARKKRFCDPTGRTLAVCCTNDSIFNFFLSFFLFTLFRALLLFLLFSIFFSYLYTFFSLVFLRTFDISSVESSNRESLKKKCNIHHWIFENDFLIRITTRGSTVKKSEIITDIQKTLEVTEILYMNIYKLI